MVKKLTQINPVLRATGVISAVMVLVGGVTFAVLQDTASLTGNTLSAQSTGGTLLVDGSDEDTTPTESEAGFEFMAGEAGDPKVFGLVNTGAEAEPVNVKLKKSGHVSHRTFNGGDDGGDWNKLPDGVNPEDIVFTFTPTDGDEATTDDGAPVTATWAQLKTHGGVRLIESLNPDAEEPYDLTKFEVSVEVNSDKDIEGLEFDLIFGIPEVQ